MLNWIIAFLQRIQTRKGIQHPLLHKAIALLPGILITVGICWIIFAEVVVVPNSAFVFIGWLILLFFLMGRSIFTDKIRPYEFLYLIYIPLLLSTLGVLLMWFHDDFAVSQSKLIILICIGVYPLLHLINIFLPIYHVRLIRLISHITLTYNIGFFLLLTINYLCLTFGVEISGFGGFSDVFNAIVSSVSDNNASFWQSLLQYFMIFLVVTYPIFTLFSLYTVQYSRKLLVWGCMFSFFIIVVGASSNLLRSFYEYQSEKAYQIFVKEGENQKGFEEAHVWFLESALLYLARQGTNYENSFFEKLYDSSLYGYFGERLGDAATTLGFSSSFATDASKVGDAANVLLTLSEIHSETTENIIKTQYTLEFQNTIDENQEVIVFFQTPSIWSVVSDLKLGLDLQLIGQVAPRGAARQVYEDSLRFNRDPALIEKVGLNSYSLRIFPIPGKTVNQGRQKVQVEILTPLMNGVSDIIYAPKFSFINLKIDDSSRAIAKIYNQGKLSKEDIIDKNVEEYLKKEHTMAAPTFSNETKNINEYCLPKNLSQFTAEQVNTTHYSDKISLFFDISKSAERNKVGEIYKNLYSAFKQYGNALNDIDVYTYNFDVQRVSDLNNLVFWGYSDTDRIMNYIDKNGFKNQRIVIVTDDDSFNLSTVQNQIPELQNIYTNKIDIIKIGANIKRYKTDITNLVASTGGNMFEITDLNEIGNIVGKIKTTDRISLADGKSCTTSLVENKEREKIQAGIVSNILLGQLSPEYSTSTTVIGVRKTLAATQETIYSAQNEIATTYNIVNQYNSLIALETDRQQNDLQNYSNRSGAYNTEFENFAQPGSTPRPMNNINFDDGSQGINPGLERVDDSLKGASSDGSFFGMGSSYRSRTYSSELNLGGIILLLIYLVEIIACINFIFMVRKGRPEENIANEK